MAGMMDITCQACKRRVGFAYMEAKAKRAIICPHCRKVAMSQASLQKIFDSVANLSKPKNKGRRAK